MESTTSLSSTKKPRWHRGLGSVRRLPSRVFKKINIRSSSPTPSERERSLGSISIKGFSKASSLELLSDTAAASPPAAVRNGHSASGLKGENSKREAVPLASEPGGHAVLMRKEMFTASPENTLELPIITNEIASVHAPPAAAEQLVITSEPEEMMTVPEATLRLADEQELVPTKPPHGIEEPARPPLVNITDTPSKPARSDAAVPETSGEPIGTSSIEATSYFDMPAPPENTRTGFSTETSCEPLAAPMVGWGNGEENAGCRQEESTVLEDPCADPPHHEAVPDNTIWASFPIPSERMSKSESTSIEHPPKTPSVKLLDTVPLSSVEPAANKNHMEAGPSTENSAREATALASEPVGYASLMGWEMLTASPENTHEVPIVVNEIGSIRPTPATAEQLVLGFELEKRMPTPEITSQSAIEQELVPARAESPPLIYVEDMPTDLTQFSVGTGPTSNLDILASQAIVAPSMDTNDNPSQIWAGQNSRGRFSTESSATPVQRRNGNKGQGQRKSIVLMSNEDRSNADRQSNNATPGVSVTVAIRMPEPLHLRSPREGRHKLGMHVPSPSPQDAIGQTASQNHSGRNVTRLAKCLRESTNGRNSPIRAIPKARRDDFSAPDSPNNGLKLIGVMAGVSLLALVLIIR